MQTFAREPLVHFVLIGLVVFGLQWAIQGPVEPEEDSRVILVDRVVETEVERQLTEALGRIPEPHELDEGIEAWIGTEVLVRQARELRLDVDDAIVRRRLAQKMVFVAQASTVPPEPSDSELRALYDAADEAFLQDATLTVRQLFAKGPDAQERAIALRNRWAAGEAPETLPTDPPPGGPVLNRRTPEGLAQIYGENLASQVAGLGSQITLVESDLGWHVVQVTRDGTRRMTFDEARVRLTLRWRAGWIEEATTKTVLELMDSYEVEDRR